MNSGKGLLALALLKWFGKFLGPYQVVYCHHRAGSSVGDRRLATTLPITADRQGMAPGNGVSSRSVPGADMRRWS